MSRKILIVDDEADIRSTLEGRLKSAGFETCAAANAAEAFQKVEVENPDLILLDIMLPGTPGNELARILKEKRKGKKDIPVIYLTALRKESEQKAQGAAVGGHIIFAKPFDFTELLNAIRSLI